MSYRDEFPFQTRESALDTISQRVCAGLYVIQQEWHPEQRIFWLHFNAAGKHDQHSIYASSVQEVKVLAAVLNAQAIGHDWAFETEAA